MVQLSTLGGYDYSRKTMVATLRFPDECCAFYDALALRQHIGIHRFLESHWRDSVFAGLGICVVAGAARFSGYDSFGSE